MTATRSAPEATRKTRRPPLSEDPAVEVPARGRRSTRSHPEDRDSSLPVPPTRLNDPPRRTGVLRFADRMRRLDTERCDEEEEEEGDEEEGGYFFALGARSNEPHRTLTDGPPSLRDRRMLWERSTFADAIADALSGGLARESHPSIGRFDSFLMELAALHQAVAGARMRVLPPHLLFSDRDFNEDDYEILLALDENIPNHKGASQHEINKIEIVRIPHRPDHTGDSCMRKSLPEDCAICLEKCRGGESMRRMGCGHAMHTPCLDRWLRTKAVCPICQRPAV